MPGNDMRELPRNIEERKMIGLIPLKIFLSLLPIFLFLLIIALRVATIVVVSICSFASLSLFLLVSEVSRNYSVMDLLKDIIRYKREGYQYFERSAANEPEYKKITLVEITRINPEE